MVSKIIFCGESFILLICESQTLIFITMGGGGGWGVEGRRRLKQSYSLCLGLIVTGIIDLRVSV